MTKRVVKVFNYTTGELKVERLFNLRWPEERDRYNKLIRAAVGQGNGVQISPQDFILDRINQ